MILKIGKNILSTALADHCKQFPRRWVMISDAHVAPLWGETLKDYLHIDLITFPAGEIHKTRETKQQLEDALFEKHYGRDTGLIALGGGVVTDIVGFLASTYCRGVPVIYAPTTFLAMVDASIGGKTGVDTPFGKNLIGSFYQPQAVFMDIATLDTLPEREWREGLVETLKHGLIMDAPLIQKLHLPHSEQRLLNIVHQSVSIKQNIVNQDTHDHGIRQWLNFGHTIGHAIETLENFRISHGEAVAIGLIVEAYISALSGFLDFSVVNDIEHILRTYQLPLKTMAFQQINAINNIMGLDKKSLKNIPHFVLLEGVGKVRSFNNQFTFPVEPQILDQALNWAKRFTL